jgi:hypothetical protein
MDRLVETFHESEGTATINGLHRFDEPIDGVIGLPGYP